MQLLQQKLFPFCSSHSLSRLANIFSVGKDMRKKHENLKQHTKPTVCPAQELVQHRLEVVPRCCYFVCLASTLATISSLNHTFINSDSIR